MNTTCQAAPLVINTHAILPSQGTLLFKPWNPFYSYFHGCRALFGSKDASLYVNCSSFDFATAHPATVIPSQMMPVRIFSSS